MLSQWVCLWGQLYGGGEWGGGCGEGGGEWGGEGGGHGVGCLGGLGDGCGDGLAVRIEEVRREGGGMSAGRSRCWHLADGFGATDVGRKGGLEILLHRY